MISIYVPDVIVLGQDITFEKRLLFDLSESKRSVIRVKPDLFIVLTSESRHLSPYFYLSWYNDQFDTIRRIQYEWERFQANRMALLPNSDIAIIGTIHTENTTKLADYGVVYLTKKGEVRWKKTYGGSGIDSGEKILSLDGKILIGGSSDSNKSGDKSENSRGRFDYWFLTLDLDGNKISDKTIGGNHDDRLRFMLPLKNNKFKMVGNSISVISGEKRVAQKGMGDVWAFTMDTSWNITNQIALGNEFENNPSNGILEENKSSMVLTYDKYESNSKNL
ncbi:MAG: hypothetical protein IPM48_07030 [Saprospiraceae bacterium]|nr:hypothetical protein [Saprospiraceae bacterium]